MGQVIVIYKYEGKIIDITFFNEHPELKHMYPNQQIFHLARKELYEKTEPNKVSILEITENGIFPFPNVKSIE